MAKENTKFWIALLNLEEDTDHRKRLWNGYLGWKLPPGTKGEMGLPDGWPKLIVNAPDGGWPELTSDDLEKIELLADTHGGHPDFGHSYIDFSGHTFADDTNFSGLILVLSNFSDVRFEGQVSFDETRFYGQAFFHSAIFKSSVHFYKASFDADVSLARSRFEFGASFIGVDFSGGASFKDVIFDGPVMFNDSRFEERYFSSGIGAFILADFTNAKFMSRTSFREVLFGNDESVYSRIVWPERRVDFTNAEFMATTDFRRAIFGGPPAFFNTTLHEDTDFSGIDWTQAETDHVDVDYAIRAWERLELIMSRIEKPLDRHRFFRLKMRARRRVDGRFMCLLNWLFEKIADYGWGVGRAVACWVGHWTVAGLVLFVNAVPVAGASELWEVARAALATGFANAHPFLLLGASGGYLASERTLLEENDRLSLLTVVGTTEAVLGSILLFFLLLTLRNRFRLA